MGRSLGLVTLLLVTTALPAVADTIIRGKTKVEWIAALRQTEDERLRLDASRSLSELALDHKKVIPIVVSALGLGAGQSRDAMGARNRVIEHAAWIGPAAVPALLKALSSDDGVIREDAARVLLALGTKTKPALAALRVAATRSDNAYAQIAARTALACAGDEVVAHVTALRAYIRAGAHPDMWYAVDAVTRIGAPARSARIELHALMKKLDSTKLGREYSHTPIYTALAAIEKDPTDALKFLDAELAVEPERRSSFTLIQITRAGEVVVPILASLFHNAENLLWRSYAADALADTGASGRRVLLAALDSKNEQIVNYAIDGLAREGSERSVAALESVLSDRPAFRTRVATKFMLLGRRALPSHVHALAIGDSSLNITMGIGWQAMGDAAIEPLITALKGKMPVAQRNAATILQVVHEAVSAKGQKKIERAIQRAWTKMKNDKKIDSDVRITLYKAVLKFKLKR